MKKKKLPKSPSVLGLTEKEVDKLPNPKPGEKNIHHFLSFDGNLAVKSVPWIDAETGLKIEEEPIWTKLLKNTTDVKKADFIANLPDPESSDQCAVRNLRNPITGEIVPKIVPWIDQNDRAIIFEEYIPGIEVSDGKKLFSQHNRTQEFDDPTDSDNLRFFNWPDIRFRAINTVFRDIEDREDKYVGVIGINLGGTIMMEEKPQGLVPTGQIQQMFEDHVEEGQKNCMVRSFVFPQAKMTSESEANYGIDSSQIEIDVIADMAISMTCTWNNLSEKERRKFAGFVISIGTDTCVDTMSILKMMLGSECPFSVIAVGAMKPMLEAGSDGLTNFRSAFEDLLVLRERGLRVVGLRVEGGLYDPTETRKISDKLGSSFQGKKVIDSGLGEVAGSVNSDRFGKVREDDFKKSYDGTIAFRGVDEVEFVKSTVSKDPFGLEKAIKDSDAQAVLVETYPSFTQAMKDADAIMKGAEGRPIFYVNQVLGADVDQAYEVAKELSEKGIYPINMTAEAARAKINLAVRLFGKNNQKIINFMTKPNSSDRKPGNLLLEKSRIDLSGVDGLTQSTVSLVKKEADL